MYHRFGVYRVGLVRDVENPADVLSRVRNNGVLYRLLGHSIGNTPVVEWIIRKKVSGINMEKGFER